MREFFMKTKRVGFSKWNYSDLNLATQLWGDREVTRFICATGMFTKQDIIHRLETEIQNDKLFQIQYWPIIELSTEQLIGCCGIRPFDSEMRSYEIGFHLRKKYWGMGYASEAAKAVIAYSFDALKADKLCAPPPIYTGRRLHISDCWFICLFPYGIYPFVAASVIVSIAFHEVHDAPHGKTRADGDYQHFQRGYRGIDKTHR